MPDLGWREAIVKVLQSRKEPMRYTDIADVIAEDGLRAELGATPANSVNSVISTSIQKDEHSPFVRVTRGFYTLREQSPSTSNDLDPHGSPASSQDEQARLVELDVEEEAEETGLINAFGMYWSRNSVLWSPTPKILGRQQPGSTSVDFCNQHGVYLLHDRRSVVYVGRTTEQPLGVRLKQHTVDRLDGRWDRFSWFGVYPVSELGFLTAVYSRAADANDGYRAMIG